MPNVYLKEPDKVALDQVAASCGVTRTALVAELVAICGKGGALERAARGAKVPLLQTLRELPVLFGEDYKVRRQAAEAALAGKA